MFDSEDLLSIGEVSRIFRISPKTLRHYDKIGLIKPAYVDSTSQYRYYSISQLLVINCVKEMRLLGFSLTDISKCLDQKEGVFQVDKAITLVDEKKGQIVEQLKKLQNIEQLFVFWKVNLEPEYRNNIQPGNISVKYIPPRIVVFTRSRSKYEKHDMSVRVIELLHLIHENNVSYKGPFMAIFHDDHRSLDMGGDIELCTEVLEVKPADYSFIREIPAGLYASVIHKGCNHTLITDTYPALYNWLKKLNYKVLGPSMEMYSSIT